MRIFDEFKQFISRGNPVDLAIGVIIGGAFGKMVNSIVDNLLMPPLGYITSDNRFNSLKFVLKKGDLIFNPKTQTTELLNEVAIHYGVFIQDTINFLIVSICIFLIVKGLNRLHKKHVENAPPSLQESLLTEIRDTLKSRGQKPY